MEMDSRPYRTFVTFFASALLVLAGLLASGILPLGAPNNPVDAMPVSSEATGNFFQLVVVLVQVLVLHEDDDELVEIAGRLGGNWHRVNRVIGSAQGENPGGQETREYEKGGRKERSEER